MKKVALFAVTAALLGAAAPQALAQDETAVDRLVAQCAREASRSHEQAWRLEPALRPTIEAHRDLMWAACARWLSAERTEILLSQCLAQAEAGPRHLRDGEDAGRAHVERQQKLCRKIAERRQA